MTMSDSVKIEIAINNVAEAIKNLSQPQQVTEIPIDRLVEIHLGYLKSVRRIIYGDKDMFHISQSLRSLEKRIVETLSEIGYNTDNLK